MWQVPDFLLFPPFGPGNVLMWSIFLHWLRDDNHTLLELCSNTALLHLIQYTDKNDVQKSKNVCLCIFHHSISNINVRTRILRTQGIECS
jgi:hypothetical protein